MASGTNGPPLHSRLLQKLNADVPTDWSSSSIFKVPNHLRRISEQAYEPQVISIGPYHHDKAALKKMEVYKMYYLKMLLRRRRESSLERYVTALKNREEQARKFYSEPLNDIGEEKFVEMMLLDGCFIIELIRNRAMKGQRDETGHPLTQFILCRAMHDLLLVENQIPFFILSELFDMTVMRNDEPRGFVDMAIDFLLMVVALPENQISRPKNIEHVLGLPHRPKNIKHLLGLLHDCWTFRDCWEVHIPYSPGDPESLEEVRSLSPEAKLNLCSSGVVRSSPPEPLEELRFPLLKAMDNPNSSLSKLSEEDPISMAAAFEKDALEAKPSASFPPLKSLEEAEEVPRKPRGAAPAPSTAKPKGEWRLISSATQLSEAGIIFKKKIDGRLFDIEFDKGVMSIPTLIIDDNTESILRNLVAYEQCSKGASSKCFTDYITFIDRLINTWKDVELLSKHGVIDNWLGDNDVVAAMLNKIGDSVLISKDFSYAETFKRVNEHCDRKWNQWMANLRRNYFNTPWVGISCVAGAFLLLLNLVTGVMSVLSYLLN
ncbi:hypothetical protein SLA2020_159930 [Shorea laevis]